METIEQNDISERGAAAVSEAFFRLAPEAGFELIAPPSQARAILTELRERAPNRYEWWPLAADAASTRVLVVRRTRDEARTVSDFLGADHHRLTELWRAFLSTVESCEQWHEAQHTLEDRGMVGPKELLARFIFGLRRHIRMEEELFFPLFERTAGLPAGIGPTAVMRREHREIEAALDALQETLTLPDCAAVIAVIEGQPMHPSALFHNHDAKEETVLYPMADRIIAADEVENLIAAMQAL